MIELRRLLEEAGHPTFTPELTLDELGMDPKRVASFVEKTEADAWIVTAGSREILEWFSSQPRPALALFGRYAGFPIAGVKPDKIPCYRTVVRRLHQLGHRRIVLLARKERRWPQPGKAESAFLGELETLGLSTSAYNLPEWEMNTAGLHQLLERLFEHTPPSALVAQEAPFVTAILQFCSRHGIRIPQDLSLVCSDPDPSFYWCLPSVAHIRWDSRPVVHCIVRWANNVARGRMDRRQVLTRAEFVEGGTVGRAPKNSIG